MKWIKLNQERSIPSILLFSYLAQHWVHFNSTFVRWRDSFLNWHPCVESGSWTLVVHIQHMMKRWNSNEYRYCPNIHKNFSISNVSSLIYFALLFAVVAVPLCFIRNRHTCWIEGTEHERWKMLSARGRREFKARKFFFRVFLRLFDGFLVRPSLVRLSKQKQSFVLCR